MRIPSSGAARPEAEQNPLAADLDHILRCTPDVWEELRGQRVFITGGTGFVGSWLLESFCWANDCLGLGAQAVVLTRDPTAFGTQAPHLAHHPAVDLWAGDIRTFAFPAGRFSHVIHAAADPSLHAAADAALHMFDTLVQGTRRALEFAVQAGASKFLFVSSGAVYGRQPDTMSHITEEFGGAPDSCAATSAYGEGKRSAELLCAIFQQQHGLETKIARCFAFAGPYLPVNTYYAIGNFVGAAVRGQPITVTGSPATTRSYLYAADMAIWLWTILSRGVPGRPYNVGSDQAMTMAELAQHVAGQFSPKSEIQFVLQGQTGAGANRYIPCTQRARELGLAPTVSFEEALRRYICFVAAQPPGKS